MLVEFNWGRKEATTGKNLGPNVLESRMQRGSEWGEFTGARIKRGDRAKPPTAMVANGKNR